MLIRTRLNITYNLQFPSYSLLYPSFYALLHNMPFLKSFSDFYLQGTSSKACGFSDIEIFIASKVLKEYMFKISFQVHLPSLFIKYDKNIPISCMLNIQGTIIAYPEGYLLGSFFLIDLAYNQV